MAGEDGLKISEVIYCATRDAKQIETDGSNFAAQLEEQKKVILDIANKVAKCSDTDLVSKIQNLNKSIIEASLPAQNVKGRCAELCKAWTDFNKFYADEMQKTEVIKVKENEVKSKKLNELLLLCETCHDASMRADEKLNTAIPNCSTVSEAFQDRAEQAKRTIDVKIKSIVAALVVAAAAIAVSGGTAASLITAGSILRVGTTVKLIAAGGCALGLTAEVISIKNTLRDLKNSRSLFSTTHGKMEAVNMELNVLRKRISKLRKEIRCLFDSINVKIANQKRMKNASGESGRSMMQDSKMLEKKDKELNKQQLAEKDLVFEDQAGLLNKRYRRIQELEVQLT